MSASAKKYGIASIGTFDGVHLGHCAILDEMAVRARQSGDSACAFVVDPHPLQVICGRAPLLLSTVPDRFALIGARGVDARVFAFDRLSSAMTARQFMQHLRDSYGIHTLVMGYDNNFGSDRLRDFADYRRLGAELGVDVVQVSCQTMLDGEVMSSSAIRSLIAVGDIAAANAMLGRPYSLHGRVVHGLRVGRTIGFPTANISCDAAMQLPARGVYAGYLGVDGDPAKYPVVVNIGTAPTVRSDGAVTIEAHVIDADGHLDLYGRDVTLGFVARIRGEQRFDSLEALAARIAADTADARHLLAASH